MPSGENATEVTQFVCPLNGLPISFPVVESQRLIVQLFDPETRRVPSGEKAIDLISYMVPRS